MERLTDEERKLRRLESSRKYKQTHFIDRKASDLRQRQKPEYQEREVLRLKKRYEKVKEHLIFKRAIPHFLTI